MGDYTILSLEVGPLGTNCYIVACAKTKKAAIIDPGGNGPDILKTLENKGWQAEAIINTHGHWDHIMANSFLKEHTGAELLIHKEDASFLKEGSRSGAFLFGGDGNGGSPDRLLKDGDEIKIGELILKVLHTPGHSPGGIALLMGDELFSGDTLFQHSIGRTDLYGGSYEEIIKSIKEKLLVLADETRVYPGHGPDTSIGEERKLNPYIRE